MILPDPNNIDAKEADNMLYIYVRFAVDNQLNSCKHVKIKHQSR